MLSVHVLGGAMLRECTETENQVIKKCKNDLLSYPEMYAFANRKGAWPLLIGFAVGLGLSCLLTIVLSVKSGFWIASLFMLCNAAAVAVSEILWEKLGFRKSRKADLPGKQFRVNGGTVLNYIGVGPDGGAYLTIAEDDLRDEHGSPLCIRYPVPPGLSVTIGERILLVYSDSGAYLPLRLTRQTENMIPMEPPAYFQEVDWDKTKKLPHPAVSELDKKSYLLNEKEVADFAKQCNSLTNIRVKNWVGIILLSFLILFILGLAFIFLVASDLIMDPIAALVTAGVFLVVWAVLTVLITKAALSGAMRGFHKLQYKKKVMFLGTNTVGGYKGAPMSYIFIYEYVDGSLKEAEYLIANNVFLPKDIPYGRLIYKYTKEAESYEKGLNYFCER